LPLYRSAGGTWSSSHQIRNPTRWLLPTFLGRFRWKLWMCTHPGEQSNPPSRLKRSQFCQKNAVKVLWIFNIFFIFRWPCLIYLGVSLAEKLWMCTHPGEQPKPPSRLKRSQFCQTSCEFPTSFAYLDGLVYLGVSLA
jgi:hypothetical protein